MSLPPSRVRRALVILVPAPAAAAIFLLSFRWSPAALLPFLLAAPLFPVFASAVRRGDDRSALSSVLVWAVALILCATAVSMLWQPEAEAAILRSRQYAEESVQWVRTGEGPEGSPALFLPRHALVFALFSLVSVATGGLGALVLGAAQLNYMSYYVASLCRLGGGVPAVLVLGWPPWALVRVVSYIALGTALARPLLARIPPRPEPAHPICWPLLWAGLGGVLLDAVLKTVLAAPWRRLLLAVLGGTP
ncbi:MAG: hypothetical protein V3S71_05530 [Acidobacteriota bacterium]